MLHPASRLQLYSKLILNEVDCPKTVLKTRQQHSKALPLQSQVVLYDLTSDIITLKFIPICFMGLSFHQGLLQNPAGGPSDAAYLPGPYMHLVALGRGCSYNTFFQKKMGARQFLYISAILQILDRIITVLTNRY